MVTVEEARASFERRRAERSALDASAAAQARALLPRLTKLLAESAATEISLFGSLAGGAFGVDSDIDLATRGLGFRDALRLSVMCTELAGRSVEIVRLEDAPSTLVDRVNDVGELLTR